MPGAPCAGDWTQGLTGSRQEFYQLNNVFSPPILLFIIWDKIFLCTAGLALNSPGPQVSIYLHQPPLHVAEIKEDMHQHT